MAWPNYTVEGKPVCQHIFCDNRSARQFARHKITQVFGNGYNRVTLVCDAHLPVIEKVLDGNDFVEAL